MSVEKTTSQKHLHSFLNCLRLGRYSVTTQKNKQCDKTFDIKKTEVLTILLSMLHSLQNLSTRMKDGTLSVVLGKKKLGSQKKK